MFTKPGLLAGLSLLASAMPIMESRALPRTRDTSSTTACVHAGNPDFYGLGIRLGIYLQLLCTMTAMFDFDSQSYSLLFEYHDTNLILLFAIFVALVKSTPEETIDDVDTIILLRLLWLIIICGFSLGHLSGEFKGLYRTNNFFTLIGRGPALIFRYAVITMISVYNVWFWFRGLDAFHATSVRNCPPYAFFFIRLDALGRLRTFYKFTSVLLALFPPNCMIAYLAFLFALVVFVTVVVFVLIVPFARILVSALMAFDVLFHALGWRDSRVKKQDMSNSGQHDGGDQKRGDSRQRQPPSKSYLSRRDRIKLVWTQILPLQLLQRTLSAWTKLRRRKGHQKTVSAKEANALTQCYVNQGESTSACNFSGQAKLVTPTEAAPEVTTGSGTTDTTTGAETSTPPDRVFVRYKIYLGAILIYFAFAVIGVELTLIWNVVQNSYDIGATGQLIPFILGMLGAVKVIMKLLGIEEDSLFRRFISLVMFQESVTLGRPRLKRTRSAPELHSIPSRNHFHASWIMRKIHFLRARNSKGSESHDPNRSDCSQTHDGAFYPYRDYNDFIEYLLLKVPEMPSRSLLSSRELLEMNTNRCSSFSSDSVSCHAQKVCPDHRKYVSAWFSRKNNSRRRDFMAEEALKYVWGDTSEYNPRMVKLAAVFISIFGMPETKVQFVEDRKLRLKENVEKIRQLHQEMHRVTKELGF